MSPTFLPEIALPSGDLGEYTSMGAPLSSREASRKVTSSSSLVKRMRLPSCLPRGKRAAQEGNLILVLGEADRDRHAGADYAIGARRLANPGVLQDVGDLADPALHLALFVLGRVVAAVLAQVAFSPGRLDLLRDLDAAWTRELVKLRLETVIRLLGQPGEGIVAGLGHGNSLGGKRK